MENIKENIKQIQPNIEEVEEATTDRTAWKHIAHQPHFRLLDDRREKKEDSLKKSVTLSGCRSSSTLERLRFD